MLTAIRQWVVKTMMKGQTGVVQTLPKKELIELNTQITAERMMRNGINPEDMKTVGQVENVVKQIDTPKVNVNTGVTSVKKADVMDTNLKEKFYNYPTPKAIIEEWEKVQS